MRVLIIILFVLLVLCAAVPFLFVIQLRTYPIDYFPGEGDLLFYTHQLLRGQPIYSTSADYPLLGNLYPPVYYWITTLCGLITPPTLGSMRILALVPVMLTMFIVWRILRMSKTHAVVVCGSVLLIPACYSLSCHFMNPRFDGWLTFFCLVPLYFFMKAEVRNRDLILAGLFAALALFTKQTAIFGMFAIYIHLLITQFRKGVIASASAAGFCFILLGISYKLYGSDLIQACTGLTVHRRFLIQNYSEGLVPDLAATAIILSLAVARLVGNLVRRQWDFLDTYVVGQSLMTILIGFEGAGSNYCLPLLPALVMAAALFVQDILNISEMRKQVVCTLAALTAIQLILQVPYLDAVKAPQGEFLAEAYVAEAFLAKPDGPVYADRLWGSIADRPFLQKYFVEPVHLRCLPEGRLSFDVLEEPFRKKEYLGMILRQPSNHTTEALTMMVKYYHVVRKGFIQSGFGRARIQQILYLVPNP